MNKKILLAMLLGTVAFLNVSIVCKAICVGEVCFDANGKPIQSIVEEQEGCPEGGSCFYGDNYGSNIEITSAIDDTGKLLGDYKIHLDMADFKKYGIEPPSRNNGKYPEEWVESIEGLGGVINDGKTPNPLQQLILDKMYEDNCNKNGYTGTKEDFYSDYKQTVLKNGNNKLYNYKNEPGATICRTDGSDCQFFTSFSECTDYYGSNYGCWAVQWAQDNCGLEKCVGNDEGMIKQEKSCIEKKKENGSENPEYDCCVELYGEEKCNGGGPNGGNVPIEPGTCNPPESEPISYLPPVLIPQESEGSIGCGNTYTTYSYDYGTTSCEYVNTLITTVRTEKYPGTSGTYEAGERFNFSNVVYWHSTRTERIWDDSPLKNELAIAKNTLDTLKAQKECLEQNITDLEEAKAQLTCEGGYTDDNCVKESCVPHSSEPNFDYDKCYDDCYVPEDCSEKEQLEAQYNQEIKEFQNQIDALTPQINEAEARIAELNDCGSRAYSFKSTSSSSSGNYTLSSTYLKLDKYTQSINSIKGIAKNSGKLLTKNELNNFKSPYFTNDSSFVIPIETKNGTNGEVVAVSNGNALYSCPIGVRNMFYCNDNNCGSGGLNVIYRPISLTNPFPNLTNSNKYRKMGANWNETYAQTVIENNRGVSDYDIYKTTPIYTIELTPAKIKEIRKYNDKISFNNFDMKCSNGYLCSSNFLWRDTTNGYNFSDIVVKSESCATSDGWSNCYGGDA